MFAFGLCPHHSCGTPVTSLAVPGGHFSPNCLFVGLGVLGEAPCDCSNSARITGFAVVTAEMRVSGLCLCSPGAQAGLSLVVQSE